MKLGDTVVLKDGSEGRLVSVATESGGYISFRIMFSYFSWTLSPYNVDWPATEAANEHH